MDKDKLAQRLMATFLEELHEHVGTLNRDLLTLEKDPSDDVRGELLTVLFRAAHSMKGAARAVNVELIEQACHCMEDLLSEIRDGQRNADAELFAVLFKTVDAIEEAGMRLREEQDLTGAPLHDLLPQLNQVVMSNSRNDATDSQGSVPLPREAKDATADSSTKIVHSTTPEPHVATMEVDNTEAENTEATLERAERESSPQLTMSVRVPAAKLDALLAQSGELLVARQRVQSRVEDVVPNPRNGRGLERGLAKNGTIVARTAAADWRIGRLFAERVLANRRTYFEIHKSRSKSVPRFRCAA